MNDCWRCGKPAHTIMIVLLNGRVQHHVACMPVRIHWRTRWFKVKDWLRRKKGGASYKECVRRLAENCRA